MSPCASLFNIHNVHFFYDDICTSNTQAWAFATAARRLLGKSPNMNMLNFDKEIWTLHRKLHHRFLKFRRMFTRATEELEEYQQKFQDGETVTRTTHTEDASPKSSQVVCLLLSDSEGSAFAGSDSDASVTPSEHKTTPSKDDSPSSKDE